MVGVRSTLAALAASGVLDRGRNRAIIEEAAGVRPGTPAMAAVTALPKRGKYNNVPTDGAAPWGGTMTYPSAGHARVADRHAAEKAAGLIKGWSIEVSIVIGQGPRGYRRHKADFIARMADNRLRLTEFKGFDHADGKQRRADLEALGFVVEIVR